MLSYDNLLVLIWCIQATYQTALPHLQRSFACHLPGGDSLMVNDITCTYIVIIVLVGCNLLLSDICQKTIPRTYLKVNIQIIKNEFSYQVERTP
jgi:hypothetical protein